MGLALLLENLNRRLRSARELPELLNVPVLAVLPRKGRSNRLFAPIEVLAGQFGRLPDNSPGAQARRLTARSV
jgi:hypothetical protein